MLSHIEIEEKKGYVDYITLSSSVQFSINYSTSFEELSTRIFNNVKCRDYHAIGYLEGLIVVHEHYKDLFLKYKDKENVVFVIDLLYIFTETTHYKNYWKLSQYLDVLELLTDTIFISRPIKVLLSNYLSGWNVNPTITLLYMLIKY